jgi:hypothetical protein
MITDNRGAVKMTKHWLCIHIANIAIGFALASTTVASAQQTAKSYPNDTTQYVRPSFGGDTAGPIFGAPSVSAAGANILTVVDTVVNNTDPSLKNTDTFNDGETSIAINPANNDEIVISAFSSSWSGGNAAIWHSTDGGTTWTKQFTIPVPPGVGGTGPCPCDQTFDYGPNGVLFGTFLTTETNVYTGSTTDPANAASWSWWLSGGVAQRTNRVASSVNNADQPWLLHNRGTSSPGSQNVFVAYDDFGVSPVGMHVSTSVNNVPPQFSAALDKFVGSTSGAINPGHRLAQDPRNGWIYSLHQNCITNCALLTSNPKTIQYYLNRSTDEGSTWTLNGSSTGIVVATADSTQPQPKFGTVNALLGGVLHGAVDPQSGDLYYVYGNRDASGNNRLAIRRVFDDGAGGVNVGSEHFVVGGTVTAALPSVAVTEHGAVGVFYYTYNGMVSGFPQFTAWLATSTDQGATFTHQALKTFLSPATDNSNGRQRVFGDYMQTKAVGECFLGAFTANGAAFGRSTANNDPIFYKACVGGASPHDFNGNGKSDILWRNNANGWVSVWLMNGQAVKSVGLVGNHPVPTTWHIAGTGDFDGDGKADLVWRNNANGWVSVWLMNGKAVKSVGLVGDHPVSTKWHIAGTGDFDGDGKADLLFRHANGLVSVWYMQGLQMTGFKVFGKPPNTWRIVSTGDYSGDGHSDILWRNVNGWVAVWLFNDDGSRNPRTIKRVVTSWTIVE